MFQADKDIKLGSGRRGQGREGRDEVLENARRERAQREKARASRGQAITIQRWYRGRSAAVRCRAKERADWDRKISDFGKLQRTLVARGIPFTPPVKFVLTSLQQLLFFFHTSQDSARLCLFCESVLVLCVSQPDPSLNPAAHLVGIIDDGVKGLEVRGEFVAETPTPALRLRLRSLLSACLNYVGMELNKGVTEGNAPLKVLLMLTGSTGHVACPSGMPEPGLTPPAIAARAAVCRSCTEILVFELALFATVRDVLLGGPSERNAVASATGGTSLSKPPPGRRGALLGAWELVLTALDAVGTITPTSSGAERTPPAELTTARGAITPLRAAFVSNILSVPLLPSRLGVEGVALLLKERTESFIDCMRAFRTRMQAAKDKTSADNAVASDGVNKQGKGRARSSTSIEWHVFRLPPPPVSCCSTEAFLLGNLVAMGTKMPLDGGRGSKASAAAAGARKREQREFMLTVTSLLRLKAIPDSLLTDKQAITWQYRDADEDGGSGSGTTMTALAVPQAVQDQVSLLVADRWIRAASKRALEGINEGLLQRCSEAERLENKETLEASAANLAVASVQKQREEASRGFISKWAEKLRQKLFSATDESAPPPPSSSAATAAASPPPSLPPGGTGSGLIDSTAASRAAALGQQSSSSSSSKDGKRVDPVGSKSGDGIDSGGFGRGTEVDAAERAHNYDADGVLALSELVGVLLRRWGTGANASNQVMQGVLNTLCFSLPCVARLWAFVLNESPSFDRFCDSAPVGQAEGGGLHATVAVMCCLFCHLLVVLDDAELYEKGRPLPLHHIRALVKGLKRPLFVFHWEERSEGARVSTGHFGAFFAGAAERLLKGLYVRNSRRALCRSEAWVVSQAESNRVLAEIKTLSPRARRLLHAMPYCMSLTQRMRVFEHLVKADKSRHQPENTRGIPIRVRRGHVLEDGLAALGSGGRACRRTKERLVVIYTGAAGHEESGIDMGGLFKDFWTDLSGLAFDINYGLFRITKEGLMYPNPSSHLVHGPEHLRLFEFLGRILGKALYEGITVQPEFATFFLGFIRGDYNFLHLFHDLNGVDPELYRNLMFLKTYDGGDVEDLCLAFTVSDEAFGANTEVDLVPGGSNRAVTSANRLEYVNRVAKHHLVDGVKAQAEAFTRGLWEVIDPQWLQMFSEPELQVLISGSNKVLDVEDLKRHTRYSGGFVGMDRTVRRFWSVVKAMNAKERAALLRFVTSCERPPPLGFESMDPPFSLHRVGIRSDGDRLPTASTCFNTLKLPTYSSEKVMRDKLLTSIFSGTGFELS